MLLALENNPSANDACFHSLGQVVDKIVFHEISLDGGALEDLRGLVRAPVKSETEDLEKALSVLAASVSRAEPERGNIQVLLTGYGKWLRTVSDVARPHFLEILPNIAPLLKELSKSGVDRLIASFSSCASSSDYELLTGCIVKYQETSGEILLAAADIATAAIRDDSRPLIEKLMAAVTPEAMYDSKPARELLPAVAKLKTAAAMGVCVAVARENHSSALNLARQIQQGSVAYLNSFQRIVEEVGISMIGYGTKQLPVLFQKAGDERATQFVEQGVAIARRYGRLAAEEFFEQKTAAAKLFANGAGVSAG